MYQLNDKVRELKPYDPITGSYSIRLDANESFILPPADILRKIESEIAATAFHRYPDPYAVRLCKSFAEHYGVNSDFVTAGNGSDELISVICTAFLMKGDTMMTLEPDFSMYRFYSSLVETRCVSYQKNNDLTIDVDSVIRKANENNVRLLIFSNPCNPTSLGLTREQVRRLIRGVSALVVLDEAYMDFWDQSLLGEIDQYDNLIVLRTCSKAFGMAAVRLGFAAAGTTLTNAIRAVKSPYNVNSLSQAIGAVILREKETTNKALVSILNSCKELYGEMTKLERQSNGRLHVFPTCTNFLLVKTVQADRVYQGLLERGIAVRLMGDSLRITAGAPEENDALLKNIKELL